MRIQNRIHGGGCLAFDFESTQDVKNWLKETKNDRIINILIKKSNLTKIQFETFILDLIFRTNRINELDNKLRIVSRSDKDQVSRGSFNRTRKQALTNIVRSIYTVLLFGYLGLFDTPQLEPFIEGANRLKSYMESIKEDSKESDIERNLEILTDIVEKELLDLSNTNNYYSET